MTVMTLAKLSDLKHAVHAMVQIGTVCASKASEGKALVRVDILGRQSDWMPVLSMANDFVKVWMPPKTGMQVLVVSPLGDANGGFVLPAIFNVACKEPAGANDANVIVEVGACRIEVEKERVKIKAPQSVTIDTPKVSLSGDLNVAGNITDSRGDLTGHTHNTTDGATAVPR